MRVPFSWLRELIALPDGIGAREVADALVRQGLEVERVEALGADIAGQIVVARVLTVEVLTEFKKPIRWVSLDDGAAEPRWVICGADNFAPGDWVVVVRPGSVLPGGFEVSARETYGHTSQGMICSARELGMGEDHSGIIVLPPGTAPAGADAIELLGLRDWVIDIAVTPDRGYALSMRGIAREVATAFDIPFIDPVAAIDGSIDNVDETIGEIVDASGADRLVLRRLTGFQPAAPSPIWLQRRLALSGMRSISLAVDVTNYVMLELGQPLHAFDSAKLSGRIRVRAAQEGETLETLDHVRRTLISDDLVIADNSGALALAGTMGGLTSEMTDSSTEITLEAAHFVAGKVARMSRRHKLSSEASRRFERGVDPTLGLLASARAVALLVELGNAKASSGLDIDRRKDSEEIELDPDYPTKLVGRNYPHQVVERRLIEVGCTVDSTSAHWRILPPAWRPDLTLAEDLIEEVARLEGYDSIPSLLPAAPASRGLTGTQRTRRRIGMALAGADFVEVLSYPFISAADLTALGIGADDERARLIRLANPISEESPFMRTTLIPGLVLALKRNLSRGLRDLAIFEMGSVFIGSRNQVPLPLLGVDRAPTESELSALMQLIPRQPQHVAGLLAGARETSWQSVRAADWTDAVAAAEIIARAAGTEFTIRPGTTAPWHPGRCAEFLVNGQVVGQAGELHPRTVRTLELPARTAAFELNLDLFDDMQVVQAPEISAFPPAVQDVALIVSAEVLAADVAAALQRGGGDLLEAVTLFDVYTGEQVGAGRKSLAYTLTFRAQGRTLTAAEAGAVRQAAVAATAELGAELRDQ